MKQTLKDYLDDFLQLPGPIKIFIVAALFITLVFSVNSGIKTHVSNQKIKKLERENFDLNRKANDAEGRAAKAETEAANQALRADSLESQIQTLEAKEKQTDEKIITQSQKSSRLNDDLRRVRSSAPANTSTADLERRLTERYGQTVGSQ